MSGVGELEAVGWNLLRHSIEENEFSTDNEKFIRIMACQYVRNVILLF